MSTGVRTWIGVAIFAATAVGIYPLMAPLRLKPASLILITLDTTDVNRIGLDGRHTEVMPTLAAWAQRGRVFDDASAGAALTLPAHANLLTGRMPPGDGVRDGVAAFAEDPTPTLAEALHRVGYRTGAFVSSVVLDGSRGFGSGFDVYGEVNHAGVPARVRRPANETVEAALAWLQTADADPFFLWVHLDDTLPPSGLPEPLRSASETDPTRASLAFVDSELRRIQEFLDAHQLTGRTAIVVAADRGEPAESDEAAGATTVRGDWGRVRLPLIFDWPGLSPGHVATAVRLTDVAPTVVALEEAPQLDADGCSFEPLLHGRPMLARPFLTDAAPPR